MSRKAIATGVICGALLAGDQALGQRYSNLDGCIRQLYDPTMYNWFSYQNNCSVAVTLRFIPVSRGYGGGEMNLRPGQTDSTGESRNEVLAHGGFNFAVCAANEIPVEPSGSPWNHAAAQYHCKPR